MIDMKHSVLFLMMFLLCACGSRTPELASPEEILAQTRADTAWIKTLDSLAQDVIGPGARCIDPVHHTFSYDGRTWFFNEDWGGVLEIPSDFLPEDDRWQAVVSFHGTRAWSPDSLLLVVFYAGFQEEDDKETFFDDVLSGLSGDDFTIQSSQITDNTLLVQAFNEKDVHYYGRYMYADADGVEYAVSVQYKEGQEERAKPLIEMAKRYPVGPSGKYKSLEKL